MNPFDDPEVRAAARAELIKKIDEVIVRVFGQDAPPPAADPPVDPTPAK